MADYVVAELALTFQLAPGFPAVPVKFVIRRKAVRWERALAGFPGLPVGGENQAQPVLMTNVGGLEPGTFGKPLIFGSFHQGKELGYPAAMSGIENSTPATTFR